LICCTCCTAAVAASHSLNAENSGQTQEQKQKENDEAKEGLFKAGGILICVVVMAIIYGVWNITDIILYGFNIYTDGNGLPMI
jgi:hypothetical protein